MASVLRCSVGKSSLYTDVGSSDFDDSNRLVYLQTCFLKCLIAVQSLNVYSNGFCVRLLVSVFDYFAEIYVGLVSKSYEHADSEVVNLG